MPPLDRWQKLFSHVCYHGAYQDQVANSVRALRLLTFEQTGGIIAAATTSLPEAIGAERNYDYRYVWLRDAGMVVSALIGLCSDGFESKQFLEFVCGYDWLCQAPNVSYGVALCANRCSSENFPLSPVAGVDGETIPDEVKLGFTEYCNSQPVRIVNRAKSRLYQRHLENADSQQEGAFLAGTLWVAQYWVTRRDCQCDRTIVDAALACANDLGFFAEEADPQTKQMLGNFPQTFVHAAFIRAVIDLETALEQD